MAQQLIDIGTTANDGTGDQLRDAFDKVNDNDTELYTDKAINEAAIAANAADIATITGGTATVVRTTAPALPHGVAGDLEGMIARDDDYLYVCIADYVDTATIIWKRIALPAPTSAVIW